MLAWTDEGMGMTELYPPIEPYDYGRLDVGDGNLVYWEACGNPDGKPAVMVHGGPGQGCVLPAPRLGDHVQRDHHAPPFGDRLALARAWPDAELLIDDHSGHRGSDIKRAWMLGTLGRFAGR